MAGESLKRIVSRGGYPGSSATENPEAVAAALRSIRTRDASPSRSTFVIEMLLLMLCLILVVTVSVVTTAKSMGVSDDATRLERAVVCAMSAAEAFEADPEAGARITQADGFDISYDIDRERLGTGELVSARIGVSDEDGEAYSLTVSSFMVDDDKRAKGAESQPAGVPISVDGTGVSAAGAEGAATSASGTASGASGSADGSDAKDEG